MQEALSSCLKEDLRELLGKSKYIGILTDETTDIGTSKILIIYVRSVTPDATIATQFLSWWN